MELLVLCWLKLLFTPDSVDIVCQKSGFQIKRNSQFAESRVNFCYTFRLQTDIHLGTEEWDRDLLSEDWEPEMIVAKMPEFLEFVRDVHQFISNFCKNEQSS